MVQSRQPLPVWLQYIVLFVGGAIVLLFTPPGELLRSYVYTHLRQTTSVLTQGYDADIIREFRLGSDYQFVRRVRELTSRDAVILMTDQSAPSSLNSLMAKSQLWTTYFLYPRRVLYLHQQGIPWYEKARWLITDGKASVDWIAPEFDIRRDPEQPDCVPFNMGWYLSQVRAGRIPLQYAPPSPPSGHPKKR